MHEVYNTELETQSCVLYYSETSVQQWNTFSSKQYNYCFHCEGFTHTLETVKVQGLMGGATMLKSAWCR